VFLGIGCVVVWFLVVLLVFCCLVVCFLVVVVVGVGFFLGFCGRVFGVCCVCGLFCMVLGVVVLVVCFFFVVFFFV